MNLRQINLLIFVSFFPVFAFRSNLNFTEIFYLILIFTVPILLINYFLLEKKIINNFFLKVYLSTIIIFGIDNNVGLWNGIIQPIRYSLIDIFGVIYIPALILMIILIFFSTFIIKKADNKFYNVILVFVITLFIFNIFDQTKSYKKIPNFVNSSNTDYKNVELVIIFDEMSGFKSFESLTDEGLEFNILAKKFFKKHNFEFYSDAKSIAGNTITSVSALLNHTTSVQTRSQVTRPSPNYFIEYELTKSLFFDKFNNISIYQGMHFDYCNFKNIYKCEGYSPFNKNKYLPGYKDTFFSKIISLWKINGSISSTFIWRLFRELRIVDSNLEPEGHKTSFQHLFQKIKKDVDSKNYDLIFVHTYVPHRPYGFNKSCDYDGSLSTLNRYKPTKDSVEQHNLERKCVLIFLDKFLEELKISNNSDSINLTILSDHGARVIKEDNSYFSTIYAYRNSSTNYKEFKKEITIQKVFADQYN